MKRLFATLIMVTLIFSVSFSDVKNTQIAKVRDLPIEITISDAYTLEKSRLVDNGRQLSFIFSVTNKIRTTGLKLIISAYNEKGNLRARLIWKYSHIMLPKSQLNSIMPLNREFTGDAKYSTIEYETMHLNGKFKGAAKYSAEITVLKEVEPKDAYDTSTANAIEACGKGKVSFVTCDTLINGDYVCKYSCKDKEYPGHPELTALGPKSDEWTIAGVDRTTKPGDPAGFFAALEAGAKSPNSTPNLEDYEEVSVRFTNGRSYRLPLYRVEPIAVLAGEDGTPVLMVAGADCVDCGENTMLRFYVLGGRELKRTDKRYSYPGSLTAYDTGNLVSRTRTLYGKCLSDRNDVVVWFEEFKGKNNKWQKATMLGRITKAGSSYTKVTEKEAPSAIIAERLKRGVCKEMAGVARNTEP